MFQGLPSAGLISSRYVAFNFLLLSKRKRAIVLLGTPKCRTMKPNADVEQGTLALMVLKTLQVLGPLHGYGIARRIEQICGDLWQ